MKIKKSSFSLRLSPRFFEMMVKAVAVVMVWRGMWNVLDVYFFPNQPMISNILCIVVGIFLLYLPDQSIDDLI